MLRSVLSRGWGRKRGGERVRPVRSMARSRPLSGGFHPRSGTPFPEPGHRAGERLCGHRNGRVRGKRRPRERAGRRFFPLGPAGPSAPEDARQTLPSMSDNCRWRTLFRTVHRGASSGGTGSQRMVAPSPERAGGIRPSRVRANDPTSGLACFSSESSCYKAAVLVGLPRFPGQFDPG